MCLVLLSVGLFVIVCSVGAVVYCSFRLLACDFACWQFVVVCYGVGSINSVDLGFCCRYVYKFGLYSFRLGLWIVACFMCWGMDDLLFLGWLGCW